jgi:hypothetical protein
MRKIINWLTPYHRFFVALFVACFGLTCAFLVAGCAGLPQWLSDAPTILATVGTSITSVIGLLAALTGNPALSAASLAISAWITKVSTAIQDVETLVKQYQADESTTLLGDIEAALATAEADINTDFSNLGLPASFLSVVTQIAALALSQLQAWGTLIPSLSAKAMESVSLKVPYSKKEYEAAFNKILDTPTGDATVDAALARIKRL